MNKALSLTEKEKAQGIVAASAGNHAQGVAYSMTYVGAHSKIVMPLQTPLVKITATRGYGAEVLLHGDIYDESYKRALEVSKEGGHVFIHPFEDPHIIAGQGSLGLEVMNQMKGEPLDSIVVPIGGGGLISGVAIAIKESMPSCKVIGVVPENCSAMKALSENKSLESISYKPSIADGTSLKEPSSVMYNQFIKRYVDDVCSVDEETIASAMVYLLERAKTVVEGSGALSLAAVMKGGLSLGKKTCLVLSGGNLDMNLLSSVIERGLAKAGRIVRFSVVVSDSPGVLSKLTDIIARHRANILQVEHDRIGRHLNLRETVIQFLLETKGVEHCREVLSALRDFEIKK